MKNYSKPEAKIVRVETEDIIQTSGLVVIDNGNLNGDVVIIPPANNNFNLLD